MEGTISEKPARSPSLTDVEGILVGHYTFSQRPTGCTVITSRSAFRAGVDVRGGAPGTRETDLLKAENTVETVHGILLSGGSAFGLDAASGVVKYLEEQGLGFDVRGTRVPVVCGAVLYDLLMGDPKVRPDAKAGYEAARAANATAVREGNIGAGAGCSVGKILGPAHAMKSGLGSWALRLKDGLTVGALVAVNAAGDVVDPRKGKIIAGARNPEQTGFWDIVEQMRQGREAKPFDRENTVIGVVATNAALSKAQCTRVAQMAQDALARCIYPSHTPWDGDTIFAVATGRWSPSGGQVEVGIIGALAADALAVAIIRGVEMAEPWGAYPSMSSFPSQH